MMKPESVSILRCPRTHEPLRLVSEPGSDGSPQQVLVSVPSGEKYAVRDSIPVLLDQDAVSGLNQHYQDLYNKVARFYDPALRLMAYLMGGREQRFRSGYLQELESTPDSVCWRCLWAPARTCVACGGVRPPSHWTSRGGCWPAARRT